MHNAFTSLRPRGVPGPSKAPIKYVRGAIYDKATQAIFGKPRMPEIVLENREVGAASSERRRAISKAGI